MAKDEVRSIPQIACELISHLPKAMDDELKKLVASAEEDPHTTIEIINLFSKHEVTRRWLQEQVKGSSQRNAGTGWVSLAGNPSLIPVSQKWICPHNPCNQWIFVMQEGEDPPICQVHKMGMVRGGNSKG